MGSPHSLGPWSFMQAKLHGGAGTSRSITRGAAWACFAAAGTVKDVVSASTSKDVTERLLFVIIGSMVFSRRATASVAPLVE